MSKVCRELNSELLDQNCNREAQLRVSKNLAHALAVPERKRTEGRPAYRGRALAGNTTVPA